MFEIRQIYIVARHQTLVKVLLDVSSFWLSSLQFEAPETLVLVSVIFNFIALRILLPLAYLTREVGNNGVRKFNPHMEYKSCFVQVWVRFRVFLLVQFRILPIIHIKSIEDHWSMMLRSPHPERKSLRYQYVRPYLCSNFYCCAHCWAPPPSSSSSSSHPPPARGSPELAPNCEC